MGGEWGIILGEWGWVGHYFWVSVCEWAVWGINLEGRGWSRHYFEWVEVGECGCTV